MIVCHQNDVCEDSIGSVFVCGYCGLSVIEHRFFGKLCPVGFPVVCECLSVLFQFYGRAWYLYIVPGGYLRIVSAPSIQPVDLDLSGHHLDLSGHHLSLSGHHLSL